MAHLGIKWIIGMVVIYTLFLGCKPDQRAKPNAINLLKYGIPCTIQSPGNVNIQKVGQGNLYDVSISNGKDFDVQVFMTSATSNNLTTIRQRKKEELLSNPQFIKIIEEYNDGFLFEKAGDEQQSTYDFITILLKGENEITFQAGNSKFFTEDEVRNMIAAVRNQ